MRIALISDIHGNDIALGAVMDDICQQQVDLIISLGDVATTGPQPKQVLARLRSSGCACISGNHEAALLNMDAALEYKLAPPLIPSLHWCAGRLDKEDFDYIQSFMPFIEISPGTDRALLCYHGSPQSNTDLIIAETPPEELDMLMSGRRAVIMAGGHSHIQMLRRHKKTFFLNPGSAGNAFINTPLPGTAPALLPWAEYSIVYWSGSILSVDSRRVPFDIGALLDVISQSDIPIKSWWLQQYS